ncbi:hypothetical protein BDV97DRAFT_344236 [Delphinella strobiligena]|nr:hypothetical protein BDV97DRAFT_344236 [Delphinella strobiligena]
MARLNEAPLPTESIDSLKRRFVRQNRELAKNNSAQCLRIRTLECDVSRLLSENLNLREEILRLQTELSAAQSNLSPSSLACVKEQLEAKLRDFGALISEIGNPRSQDTTISKRHIDPSSWRPEIPIAALSSQSNRLSSVFEEQASPGGRLHQENLPVPRFSDQSNESPDLGPPPVARFDCEDPIKFDPEPHADSELADNSNEGDTIPVSVNLETRRKRRENYSKPDANPTTLPSSAAEEDAPIAQTRPAAKRKLSLRDADEKPTAPVKDDFLFSRRSSVNGDAKKLPSNSDLSSNVSETDSNVSTGEVLRIPPRAERRVLGDKSVNMSPRKGAGNRGGKDDLSKPENPVKPLKESGRGSGRERKPRTSSIKPLQSSDPVVQTIELPPPDIERIHEMPPKTPAPDIFSPTPSEPSASRPDGRDTPPPSSRRAKAAVNYAEPNLISKMRRPGKDFANAVELNARRSMSEALGSESTKHIRTVVIKHEEGRDPDWRSLPPGDDLEHPEPGSPLGRKGGSDQRDEQSAIQESASGRTIAALIANHGQTKRAMVGEAMVKAEEPSSNVEDMDVYDFKDSSPPDLEIEKGGVKSGSRRHSSMVGSVRRDVTKRRASRVQTQLPDGDELEEDTTGPEAMRKPERAMARRRSMMV